LNTWLANLTLYQKKTASSTNNVASILKVAFIFGAETYAQCSFIIFLLFNFSSKHSKSNRKKAQNHQKTEYCTPLGSKYHLLAETIEGIGTAFSLREVSWYWHFLQQIEC